jgi:zinc-dependent metalloproteinase lipoprotein
MKKRILTAGAFLLFGVSTIFSQNFTIAPSKQLSRTEVDNQTSFQKCSTPIPSQQWDDEFNKQVEEFVRTHTDATGKLTMPTYTIPVIFHIIHNQNSVTQENISAAQVTSQLNILNADYAGTNTDASNIPSTFQSVKAGNTGIQFCLALKDPQGNTLAEPGILRTKWTTISGATDPGAASSSSAFQTLFNGTIKPATIWDPTKYLNIWVAKANGSGLLGYASFPANSTLTGLSGVENASTCGVVLNYTAVGNIGTAASPYNKGRTATHEVGHWLGLRHIWGDGTCATDYCNDTPPANTANYSCQTHPYNVGTCSGNTTGEMFMNYMDYVNDACMYMFTLNQATRMQTAMANGTYRKLLGTHGLCNSAPVAATAAFTIPATGCIGTAVTAVNSSSGSPTPTYAWSANPSTGVTFSSTTATAPTITFANTGSYTITLTASNTAGSPSTTTKVITINNCVLTQCDTLINPGDQLVNYTVGAANGGGYVSGNNGYGDKIKAEYHTQAGISGNRVTGVITYFYKNGNNGTGGNATGTIAVQLYNGNNTSGPSGAAVKTENVTLGTLATAGVQNQTVLAYAHTFATPYTLTANEFFAAIRLPTTSGDTAVVYLMDTLDGQSINTAWEQWSNNAWYAFNNASAWGGNATLGIFPIVCPASIGLNASELNNQISIFPNPSTGIINLAFALKNQSNVKIEVTNMLGQTVYSDIESNVSAQTKTIRLNDVAKGVYMITVSTANEKLIRKVVIE